MSEAVGELPLLTVQNPGDMVGTTVIDCRPPGLPVSIPLSALSPGILENARGASGFNPSREEGQSIMDMDTNEITISRIVGFPWNDPGTDVEDELPAPASSPAQCTTPAVMPVEPGDPQELGDNFDLDLAGVAGCFGHADDDLADQGFDSVSDNGGGGVCRTRNSDRGVD